MPKAGHLVEVYAKSTSGSPANPTDLIDGIKNATWSPKRDSADTTDFKDTTGAHTRLMLLRDGQIQLKGQLEFADAPQSLIRSSFDTGASVWISVYWDPSAAAGSKGLKVECTVESFDIDTSFDGVPEFSATLNFNALPVVDP